jgi:hypothetical protein
VHIKTKALLPAGLLAAALVGAACAPPPGKPPVKPPVTTTKPPVTPPPPACPAPAANSKPGPDSENPISSWGVDGTAYTSVVIGSVVYVGGSFSNAVAPNGTKVARNNLAAFCIANGTLDTSFVANFNGPVYALTTDGSSLFAGGLYSTLNGLTANRLVKLSASTGARITAFNAPTIPVGKPVGALDYSGGKVYVGGDFSVGAPVSGKKGMSVNSTTGAQGSWNPNVTDVTSGATINALKVSPNGQSVFIGGKFDTVGGQTHDDLAKTSASTGAVSSVQYGANGGVPGHMDARVLSIAVDPDNTTIYVAAGPTEPQGSGLNGGNKLYRFAADGTPAWQKVFNGDNQAVVLTSGTLYTGFHGGFGCTVATAPGCKLRVLGFTTGGAQTSFSPNSGGLLGVRGLAVGGNRLVAVGDFSNMGSTGKLHGVAIFN